MRILIKSKKNNEIEHENSPKPIDYLKAIFKLFFGLAYLIFNISFKGFQIWIQLQESIQHEILEILIFGASA